MAQIVQVGKKSTIIEGSEAELNEIRQKLHELGFNFDNYQYIELKELSPKPQPKSQPKPQKSYEITKIENGFKILIPDSKLSQITSKFPVVNGHTKRLRMDNPTVKGGYLFFALKSPYVEFSIYPQESDDKKVIDIALQLLSLV